MSSSGGYVNWLIDDIKSSIGDMELGSGDFIQESILGPTTQEIDEDLDFDEGIQLDMEVSAQELKNDLSDAEIDLCMKSTLEPVLEESDSSEAGIKLDFESTLDTSTTHELKDDSSDAEIDVCMNSTLEPATKVESDSSDAGIKLDMESPVDLSTKKIEKDSSGTEINVEIAGEYLVVQSNNPFLIPITHEWYQRVIQLRDNGPTHALYVRYSAIHMNGVFTGSIIKKSEIILEYVGEVITKAEEERRGKKGLNYYCAAFVDDCAVDAFNEGNISKLLNHSCEPNCILELLTFEDGTATIVTSAIRDISVGEELTYDYRYPDDGQRSELLKCNCGSSICRGFINIIKKVATKRNFPKIKRRKQPEGIQESMSRLEYAKLWIETQIVEDMTSTSIGN